MPGPACGTKSVHALHILAGAGIDADLVALVDEQGHADLGAGLDGGGLQGVGGGVALDTRLGLGISTLKTLPL